FTGERSTRPSSECAGKSPRELAAGRTSGQRPRASGRHHESPSACRFEADRCMDPAPCTRSAHMAFSVTLKLDAWPQGLKLDPAQMLDRRVAPRCTHRRHIEPAALI